MKGREFLKKIKEHLKLSSCDKARVARYGMSDLIIEILKSGDEFRIPNVGTLYVVTLPARQLYSHVLGKVVSVPERKKIRFRATRNLKRIINE